MMLPPTHSTRPNFLISEGLPSGPVTLNRRSPALNVPSSLVVLPTSWKAKDTVPFFAVVVADGEGDPLASLLGDDDQELPRPGLGGDLRGLDLEQRLLVGQLSLGHYVVRHHFAPL